MGIKHKTLGRFIEQFHDIDFILIENINLECLLNNNRYENDSYEVLRRDFFPRIDRLLEITSEELSENTPIKILKNEISEN